MTLGYIKNILNDNTKRRAVSPQLLTFSYLYIIADGLCIDVYLELMVAATAATAAMTTFLLLHSDEWTDQQMDTLVAQRNGANPRGESRNKP